MSINLSDEERAAIRKQHDDATKKFYEKMLEQKKGLKQPKEATKKEEPKKEAPKKEAPKK
jgi:hypothetical protein